MEHIKKFANLHNHSTHSDGVYTPEKIVSIAKQEGFGAFAITDHDTITACLPTRIACENEGLEWIFVRNLPLPAPH